MILSCGQNGGNRVFCSARPGALRPADHVNSSVQTQRALGFLLIETTNNSRRFCRRPEKRATRHFRSTLIRRGEVAQPGCRASTFTFPHVVFSHFLLMLFHLQLDFRERRLRTRPDIGAQAAAPQHSRRQSQIQLHFKLGSSRLLFERGMKQNGVRLIILQQAIQFFDMVLRFLFNGFAIIAVHVAVCGFHSSTMVNLVLPSGGSTGIEAYSGYRRAAEVATGCPGIQKKRPV